MSIERLLRKVDDDAVKNINFYDYLVIEPSSTPTANVVKRVVGVDDNGTALTSDNMKIENFHGMVPNRIEIKTAVLDYPNQNFVITDYDILDDKTVRITDDIMMSIIDGMFPDFIPLYMNENERTVIAYNSAYHNLCSYWNIMISLYDTKDCTGIRGRRPVPVIYPYTISHNKYVINDNMIDCMVNKLHKLSGQYTKWDDLTIFKFGPDVKVDSYACDRFMAIRTTDTKGKIANMLFVITETKKCEKSNKVGTLPPQSWYIVTDSQKWIQDMGISEVCIRCEVLHEPFIGSVVSKFLDMRLK